MIVYLIHLELIDGSYSQVPTNVTSEEERKQDRTGEKRKKKQQVEWIGSTSKQLYPTTSSVLFSAVTQLSTKINFV